MSNTTQTAATDAILVSLTIQNARAHSLRINAGREHGTSKEEVMEALAALIEDGKVRREGRNKYELTASGREAAGSHKERTGAWGRLYPSGSSS